MTETKSCPGPLHQGKQLPIHQFGVNKRRYDGRQSQCKMCRRALVDQKRQAVLIDRVSAAAILEDDGYPADTDYPEPITDRSLLPERYRDYTLECFEAFFNDFSGRILPDHAKDWIRLFLKEPRLQLNVPPRHAKSTIMSVWLPMWLVALDRNEQILLMSQTEELAKKWAREIAYQLSWNRSLNMTFGRFRPLTNDAPWQPGEGKLLVAGRSRDTKSGDLTFQVRGKQQQILGMEASRIIIDDIDDPVTAASESKRTSLQRKFHDEIMSRLTVDGTATVIGQRVHPRDLYGYLENLRGLDGKSSWYVIRIPAVLRWPDVEKGIEPVVLWPDQWSYDSLTQKIDDVGGITAFELTYQQNPAPEGAAFAKREWIYGDDEHPGCLDKDRDLGESMRPTDANKMYLPVTRVVSVDPATERYTAVTVADVIWLPRTSAQTPLFNAVVLDVRRRKAMDWPSLLKLIEEVCYSYEAKYLVVETIAFQKWLVQSPEIGQLKRSGITVIPHSTGLNKLDPVMGVWSLGVDFKAGRIRLPYGDSDGRYASDHLINEVLAYPYGDTDDVVMSLWFMKARMSSLRPPQLAYGQMRGPGGPGTGAWQNEGAGMGAWR
jgi:hypothetical protein